MFSIYELVLSFLFPRSYFPVPNKFPPPAQPCYIVGLGCDILFLGFVWWRLCTLCFLYTGFVLLASYGSIIHFPKGEHPLCPRHSVESPWDEASGVTHKIKNTLSRTQTMQGDGRCHSLYQAPGRRLHKYQLEPVLELGCFLPPPQ